MALQWLSLVATMWLQSINGSNSNFPAYSSELKRILSISQLQLNNLASASDAGKLLGWISGIAAAHFPLWLVLLIGSILGLVGYGIQFLFLANRVSSLSYWHIFLLTVLAGNSICWINTVCYIIAIRNFPLDRQIAVSLSTSYVGLSAKLYTNIVDVVAPPSATARAKVFLLLNSVLPLIVCTVAAPLARSVNVGKSRKLTRGFSTMFVITIVSGLFAVITSLGSVGSRFLPQYVVLADMIVVLFLPLVVPLVERIRERLQQKCLIGVHDEGFSTIENGEKSSDIQTDVVAEEIGAKLMVRRVEFWLYFFVYLFGATLGLVYLNNLGQIAESRGCSGTSSLVSLSSAFSFFGRLLPSLLDYFFPKNNRVCSRAGTMGATMAPMCGAFFLLLNMHDVSLYASTAVIGICTGAITSISVSTTIELFGTKNFGVNHNVLVSNIPRGSFLFGDFAAVLYNRGRNVSGEGNCIVMVEGCEITPILLQGFFCSSSTKFALLHEGKRSDGFERATRSGNTSNISTIKLHRQDYIFGAPSNSAAAPSSFGSRKNFPARPRPRASPTGPLTADLPGSAARCSIGRRTRDHSPPEVAAVYTFFLRFRRRSDDPSAASTTSLLVSSGRSLRSMGLPFLSLFSPDHRWNRRLGSTGVSPANERSSLQDHCRSTPRTLSNQSVNRFRSGAGEWRFLAGTKEL
ncbi:protein NUCLEAR FUSION defective [Sesamum alatum]|uniref:Protein NUCLEAR FUSION defective n=1 Tax=Sesamum alatum TaxID=300844 RepID=A0AAE2CF65_9LAMI|nr:protein NUCLEAR FUSION defective [Sesamum alatum]